MSSPVSFWTGGGPLAQAIFTSNSTVPIYNWNVDVVITETSSEDSVNRFININIGSWSDDPILRFITFTPVLDTCLAIIAEMFAVGNTVTFLIPSDFAVEPAKLKVGFVSTISDLLNRFVARNALAADKVAVAKSSLEAAAAADGPDVLLAGPTGNTATELALNDIPFTYPDGTLIDWSLDPSGNPNVTNFDVDGNPIPGFEDKMPLLLVQQLMLIIRQAVFAVQEPTITLLSSVGVVLWDFPLSDISIVSRIVEMGFASITIPGVTGYDVIKLKNKAIDMSFTIAAGSQLPIVDTDSAFALDAPILPELVPTMEALADLFETYGIISGS